MSPNGGLWIVCDWCIIVLMNKILLKIKTFFRTLTKELVPTTISATAGGLAICLGTYASRVCEEPILSPLLFAVGIFVVMVFNLGLITRFTPTHSFTSFNLARLVIILVVNLITANLMGSLANFSATPPDNLFWWSVLGGVVIGLVSLNHMLTTPYKVSLALLLMYIFVMLGLPHCVVYAFLGADFPTLMTVVAGNLVGGVALNFGFRYICSHNKK